MPIPTPERLFLPEAAAYVATRCVVPQNEAEAALERAIRVDRTLLLVDDKSKGLFDHELEEMRVDWRTGIVETENPWRHVGIASSARAEAAT